MTKDTEDKIEVTVDLEPETKEKLEEMEERYGITEDDIFNLGMIKAYEEFSLDDIKGNDEKETLEKQLTFLTVNIKALEQAKETLEKMIEIREKETK